MNKCVLFEGVKRQISDLFVAGSFLLVCIFVFENCADNKSLSDSAEEFRNSPVSFSVSVNDGGELKTTAVNDYTSNLSYDNHSGMMVQGTLSVDKNSITRSTTAMTAGYKYRVIIYTAGGSYVKDTVFTVGSNAYFSGLSLGTTYRYVALSYNSTSTPPGASVSSSSIITGLSPENDLLYDSGIFTTLTNSDSRKQQAISFRHMFPRLKVVLDVTQPNATATYTGETFALSDVVPFIPGYKSQLSVLDSTLSVASMTSDTISQVFTQDTNTGTVYTTAQRTVYLNNATSLMLYFRKINYGGNEPYSMDGTYKNIGQKDTILQKFTKQLLAGYSYTLRLTYKLPRFAESNIYWNGTTMTFVPYGSSDTTKQRYQGIFFKPGSLIGFPCVYTSGNASWSISHVVYIPNYNSGTPTNSSWTQTIASFAGYSNWNNIPIIRGSGSASSYADSTINTSTYNTSAYWAAYKGDICRYLGATNSALKGYRLPRADELAPYQTVNDTKYTDNSTVLLSTYYRYGFKIRINTSNWTDRTSSMNASGTSLMNHYITSNRGVVFPVSGYVTEGGLSNVADQYANYNTSSWSNVVANSNSYGRLMSHRLNVFQESNSYNKGAVVRCVKDNY